jgi:hypothetical protein
LTRRHTSRENQTRVRVRPCLLFAVVLTLTGNAVDLLASAAIMACCEKTDFRCAGIRTPDDCCRSMRQAGRESPATTRGAFPSDVHPAAIVPEGLDADAIIAELAPVISFKRPHDPPHLHHFNLLI